MLLLQTEKRERQKIKKIKLRQIRDENMGASEKTLSESPSHDPLGPLY
jgi:hypothetical protein